MALFDYLKRTRLLLHDESFARYRDGDLTSFINTARGQIAGEGECVRVYGSLPLTPPTQQYSFSAITFPTGTQGVAGPINVRMVTYQIPGTQGQVMIAPREWEYFNQFVLSNPVPVAGAPDEWAQFGQGASGTLFVPLPDLPYVLACDTVCYPSPLVFDTDPDAVPYLFTDAVPYFAGYLAKITAGDAEGAKGMFQLYQMFMARARGMANPSVLPHQYEQAPDPEMANRLAVQPGKAA
jgi:hypothetical protein